MNSDELQQRLKGEVMRQVSMQHQFDALRKLYDSVCIVNNSVMMETYRTQLHDLLDLQLDTQNAIMELTRRAMEG